MQESSYRNRPAGESMRHELRPFRIGRCKFYVCGDNLEHFILRLLSAFFRKVTSLSSTSTTTTKTTATTIIIIIIIIIITHFFIVPTDAHNYKIIGMLKTIKIPTIAPTCFGSRKNHHQGT